MVFKGQLQHQMNLTKSSQGKPQNESFLILKKVEVVYG